MNDKAIATQEKVKKVFADFGEAKTITYRDINITYDMQMLDNVDVLPVLERIEEKKEPKAIVDLLKIIMTDKGYEDMKAEFVAKYKRLGISDLAAIYSQIFEAINNPKE